MVQVKLVGGGVVDISAELNSAVRRSVPASEASARVAHTRQIAPVQGGQVPGTIPVEGIKERIAAELGWPSDRIRMFINGAELLADHVVRVDSSRRGDCIVACCTQVRPPGRRALCWAE